MTNPSPGMCSESISLIVFTTAYPEYAVEGFELDATDYLVKPYSFERFLKSVNRALERLHENGDHADPHGKILVVHDTIKNFLATLPEQEFMRIHKSYVINLKRIEYIEGNQVRIGEHTLPVSPAHREELLTRFSP